MYLEDLELKKTTVTEIRTAALAVQVAMRKKALKMFA